MSFEILNKTSASPTIVLKLQLNNKIYAVKLWANVVADITKQKGNNPLYKPYESSIKALRYEKRVYLEKIKPLLDNDPNLPFLPYSGDEGQEGCNSSPNNIAQFLGITDEQTRQNIEQKVLWYAGLYIYIKHPSERYNYTLNNILQYMQNKNMNVLQIMEYFEQKNVKVECMILPFVENVLTLNNYISNVSTEDMLTILKDIINGIFVLYRNNVVHNDLHPGNILLGRLGPQQPKKVLIFDWDRGYSPELRDNPTLSNEICEEPINPNIYRRKNYCVYSQCNIIKGDGYSTDFYKMLSYVAKRDDFPIILENFGIPDYITQSIITDFLKNSSKTFFSIQFQNGKKCTYLQGPHNHNTMQETMRSFGPINNIIRKVNDPNFLLLPLKYRPLDIPIDFDLSDLDGPPSNSNQQFNFISQEQGVMSQKYGQKQMKQYSEKMQTKPILKSRPMRGTNIFNIIENNDVRKYGFGNKINM